MVLLSCVDDKRDVCVCGKVGERGENKGQVDTLKPPRHTCEALNGSTRLLTLKIPDVAGVGNCLCQLTIQTDSTDCEHIHSQN